MTHCPGCRGYYMPLGSMQPFPRCPGCGNEAEIERLTAERDDIMRVYRVEHERHTATLEQRDTLTADLSRLRDAAAGRGMVSEQASMGDTAVLVVGLHERIAALEDDLKAVAEALKADLKRHPTECDCADCALLARPGVQAVLERP